MPSRGSWGHQVTSPPAATPASSSRRFRAVTAATANRGDTDEQRPTNNGPRTTNHEPRTTSPLSLKPAVLLTRRIPSAPMRLLESASDVDRHDGASAIPHDELIARVAGKQALVCLLT